MYCSNCGEKLGTEANFCQKCGHKVVASVLEGTTKAVTNEPLTSNAIESNCPLCDKSGWISGENCISCGYLDATDKSNTSIGESTTQQGEKVIRPIELNKAAVNAASIMINAKSSGLSFFLTLFFGPFGLMYATIGGGIFLLLMIFVIGFMAVAGVIEFTSALVIMMLLYLPVSIMWGIAAVNDHNKKLLQTPS